MRCAVSVLGFYTPAVCFGSCHMVSSSLGVWPCRHKYDWALILGVICHPVASLPDFRCFEMTPVPIFRCDAFRHRSILLSWYVLLDPVFASSALVKVVPNNLCPLLLFAICDYLVITGDLFSRCRVLTFILRNSSVAARRAQTATLSALFSSLSASVCTCVTCWGEHGSSASPV